MKRLTYKLEAVFECWIILFTVMGGLFFLMIFIGTIDLSYPEAIWDTFKFSNYGALILYIASVVFYPMIKNLEEGNF
ncbi:hypothetical protein ABKP09_20055 [Peribacillus frigoritolerans]|uniref:hypothetical protein n=1 Tax=Peribacillus frigoritolerans TaxID=450367 RepID=UPI0032B4A896